MGASKRKLQLIKIKNLIDSNFSIKILRLKYFCKSKIHSNLLLLYNILELPNILKNTFNDKLVCKSLKYPIEPNILNLFKIFLLNKLQNNIKAKSQEITINLFNKLYFG